LWGDGLFGVGDSGAVLEESGGENGAAAERSDERHVAGGACPERGLAHEAGLRAALERHDGGLPSVGSTRQPPAS